MHWKVRDFRGGPRSGWMGGWWTLPKAVGDGYCRLEMPLKLALAIRETVAGHRLGALKGRGGGGGTSAPSNASLGEWHGSNLMVMRGPFRCAGVQLAA